jgi:predicted transposase YbfD/YdcC
MDAQATEVFLRFFTALKDPRRHNRRHLLADILTIAILAVLCNSDNWVQVVLWSRVNEQFLRTILALPSGLPAVDTYRRVFQRIDPEAFEKCFMDWTRAVAPTLPEQVAIDGKAMRRSFRQAWDKQGMMHLVSAWAVDHELLLGQLATDSKSNEITAIPRLLDLLNLKGALVTIDAIGCQTGIAAKIVEKQADFLLAVKDNQPKLAAKVQAVMRDVALDLSAGRPVSCDYDEQTNGGHGRIETRRVWVSDEVVGLGPELLAQWPQVKSLVMVESRRQDLKDPNAAVSVETRLYISSVSGCDAKRLGQAARGHWGVENQLHWRLDVSFGEDDSRLRVGHGAENFSRVRRVVLNKLKADPSKESVAVKRYHCSIDREYLLRILRS